MRVTKQLIAGGAIAFALAGCGASGTNPPAPNNQANVAANILQFAVGTANLFGTATGLNVVATYRQPMGGFHPGDSGSLVNTPTLTLPAAITAAAGVPVTFDGCSTVGTGPAAAEISTKTIGATGQVSGAPCGTTQSTFGQSGGVFGLGIEPFNATGQGDFTPPSPGSNGTPFLVPPYPVPLYDPGTYGLYSGSGSDVNLFTPWGGPPAFLLAGNPNSVVGNVGIAPKGTAGVSEGLDVFSGIAPVAGGAYSLSVSVPANTGTVTQSASFTLPATLTTLGTATAPAYTPDAGGGGTFAFTMPAGATEAYVEIVNFGPVEPPPPAAPLVSCNGWASTATPVYYTIETTASGAQSLPDNIGPNAPSAVNPSGAAVPSICTAAQNTTANGTATSADQIEVRTIGFDYDVFGISYPNSLNNPSPSFNAAKGETDITISLPRCQVGTAACTPVQLARTRRVGP